MGSIQLVGDHDARATNAPVPMSGTTLDMMRKETDKAGTMQAVSNYNVAVERALRRRERFNKEGK